MWFNCSQKYKTLFKLNFMKPINSEQVCNNAFNSSLLRSILHMLHKSWRHIQSSRKKGRNFKY
jgi:hypothetical protein